MSEARVPWHQSFALWDVYFAVVAVSVAASRSSPARARHRRGGWARSPRWSGSRVWYLVFGPPAHAATDDRDWRAAIVFLAGVLLLYAVGIVLVDVISFVLFALCPLAFMTLSVPPGSRRGRRAQRAAAGAPADRRRRSGGRAARPAADRRGRRGVLGARGHLDRPGAAPERRAGRADRASCEASRAEVARLSHEAGVADERQRLAGDIHDTLAQGLHQHHHADPGGRGGPGTPPASTWGSRWTPPGTTSPRPGRWSPRCRRPRWTAASLPGGTEPARGALGGAGVVHRSPARPGRCHRGRGRPAARRAGGADQRAQARGAGSAAVALSYQRRTGDADGPRRRHRASTPTTGGGFGLPGMRGPGRAGRRHAARVDSRAGRRHDRRVEVPAMITVLLVDDHPVVRAGVRGMLDGEPDIAVVGEAGSGPEAVAAARALTPRRRADGPADAGLDGVDATARLLAAVPRRPGGRADHLRDRRRHPARRRGGRGRLPAQGRLADRPGAGGPGGRARRDRAGAVAWRPAWSTGSAARATSAVRPRGRGAAAGRARTVQRARSGGSCTSARRP